MNFSSIVLALLLLCSSVTLNAQQFNYGNTEPASRTNEKFHGKHCRVNVSGPSGGSYVKGVYDDPDGEIKISVDRLSYLEVHGRAKKVILTFVDLNSNVNLANLKIGAGGVEIHSTNRRSKVDIGRCIGPVSIKSAESSSITVLRGTRVMGRFRMRDGSDLFFTESTQKEKRKR